MRYASSLFFAIVFVALCTFAPSAVYAQAHAGHAGHAGVSQAPLSAPGNAIFAAVQEVIQRVEEDDSVDWADVDMERLRQHLIDMHRVAVEVDVVYQYAIEDGLLVRLAPTTEEARAALGRVFQMHPAQLEEEAGWEAEAAPTQDGYELRVTASNPEDVEKICGLGYIGLLSYGVHHQQHHWMIATGQ